VSKSVNRRLQDPAPFRNFRLDFAAFPAYNIPSERSQADSEPQIYGRKQGTALGGGGE
jgi:hypothetical protein